MKTDENPLWVVALMAEGSSYEANFVIGPCNARAAVQETLRLRPAGWCGSIVLEPINELHSEVEKP